MAKLSYVQEVIINTLLKLMDNQDFNSITVTQLTKEAQVARRTFYLNFKSKEDVLKLGIKHLSDVYQTYLPIDCEHNIEVFAVTLFKFTKDYLDVIGLLIRNQMMPLLSEEFELYLDRRFTHLASDQAPGAYQIKNFHFRYSSAYHAAGLCRLLEKWITLGMVESPEEMGAIYVQLVNVDDSSHKF